MDDTRSVTRSTTPMLLFLGVWLLQGREYPGVSQKRYEELVKMNIF